MSYTSRENELWKIQEINMKLVDRVKELTQELEFYVTKSSFKPDDLKGRWQKKTKSIFRSLPKGISSKWFSAVMALTEKEI